MDQHLDIVFSESKFSDKTMATGIRESDMANMINYHEYKEDNGDFIHPPVKIDFTPLDKPEYTINHQLQGTNLTKPGNIEQVFLQNQVDKLPEVITIDNDEQNSYPQITGNDSTRIEQVIHQDLTDIYEGTWSIINAIQTNDKIHAGQDEDTLILVAKLDNESKGEQRNHEKEKHKKV